MTYNVPNYFEQGSGKLVLGGDVEYGPDYSPSGAGAPGNVTPAANVALLGGLTALAMPADSPASADALRDDLVINALGRIELQLGILATKIDAVITALIDAELMAGS